MDALVDALKAVKAVIDTPEKWIKGDFATDANKNSVISADPKAVCFCLRGAIYQGLRPHGRVHERAERCVEVALNDLHPQHGYLLATFNDDAATTHVMVMAVLDKAIAIASAQA